jgi:hypothetical protein
MAKKTARSSSKSIPEAAASEPLAAASGRAEPVTTQRAYTLRLRAATNVSDDKVIAHGKQRELCGMLWSTHAAINAGAKVFGDWLLTLRGGISHELANEPAFDRQSVEGKKLILSVLKDLKKDREKDAGEPTETEAVAEIERRRAARIRERRILLALSWLSVEDAHGAPKGDIRVALGTDSEGARNEKVLTAFRTILASRNVKGKEAEEWVNDCAPSLSSNIRGDAVWVNRSAAFDAAVARIGPSLTRDEVWDILEPFFASREAYLTPLVTDEDDEGAAEEKAKDLVQKAGQWLSSRFGTGTGADFSAMAKVYGAMTAWARRHKGFDSGADALSDLAEALVEFNPESASAESILALISGPGYKSATRNLVKAWEDRTDAMSADDLAKFADVTAGDEAKCRSNTGGKGRRSWADAILREVEEACGFTYRTDESNHSVAVSEYEKYGKDYNWGTARHSEFAVMLDHAARRVSIGHTWIKRAEAERRRFVEDAQRLANVPSDAEKWLTAFVNERSKSSGAADAGGEYRIRRRAIEGWDRVIKRWKSDEGKSKKEKDDLAAEIPVERSDKSARSLDERVRIAGARQVQAEDEDGKFGDIQLFEALAADDAVRVWRPDGLEGKFDANPLKHYVHGHDARFKQRRFKVPAYRHPDALRHPVFGDFGNSRWSIEYAVHEAEKSKGKKRATSAANAAWLKNSHGLRMGLWNGSELSEVAIHWSSKRLTKNLAIGQAADDRAVRDVTRADRLGRAASGVQPDEAPVAAGLFALEDWNGRLQAPRAQLNAIAARIKKFVKERPEFEAAANSGAFDTIFRNDERARAMRDRIQWLVSFSAKLECMGPFVAFAGKFAPDAPAKPFVSRKGELAVRHETNEGRAGHAKLILSRLPNLRVLSVDLGHRYAAACAVWETPDATHSATEKFDIRKRIVEAKSKGWKVDGSADGLFVHIHEPASKMAASGRNKGKPVTKTIIYRRIGEDTLRDPKTGKPTSTLHPAPWARLDRQFLIKLQGEEKPARAASSKPEHGINEVKLVDDLVRGMGLNPRSEDESGGRGVDDLMSRAVRFTTLGLKRHGRMGKIAYALNPDCPGIPQTGGGLDKESVTQRNGKYVDFLTKALADWHALATDTEWDGTRARALWNTHIHGLTSVNADKIQEPKASDPAVEPPTRAERKAQESKLQEMIKPIAKSLADSSPKSTKSMFDAWQNLWDDADGTERTQEDFEHTLVRNAEGKVVGSRTSPRDGKADPGGWHARLRLLTDWIMGRRLPNTSSKAWSRNVGGLSLTRIATMRSLYQLHKAFAMRPTPQNAQGAPDRGESNVGIAQGILNAMERMREQRVKQIASRIVEAALGVGRHQTKGSVSGRHLQDRKRPQTQCDLPCHAVVIEDLRNYRTDELQTRRENKALMVWSAGKVRKYLEEACQLHGLHLRQLQPNYTSQQDSRTGLPGVRCQDVPVDRATGEVLAHWWKKAHGSAAKKVGSGKKEAEARLLAELDSHLKTYAKTGKPMHSIVRVPKKGGDLFVAAPPRSCFTNGHTPCHLCDGKRAIQADLNAAANIGLRALLDPDFPGKWWYIPCTEEKAAGTAIPRADKVKGGACFGADPSKPEQFGSLVVAKSPPAQDAQSTKKTRGSDVQGKETTNFWCDPRVSDLRPAANDRFWMPTPAYWMGVRKRVASMLWKNNGLQPSGALMLAQDMES